MKKVSLFLTAILSVFIISAASIANANVWLDETFEDASPLEQSDGAGTPAEGWDTYSANALAAPVTSTTGYAAQGARVTTKAFEGSGSYELEAGESIVVGSNYQDPANGNFQLFQFAVNVDPIPAAGDVALFSWNHDTDATSTPTVDLPLFVELVSTGSSVDIIGGRGVPSSPTESGNIGTLNSSSDWAYITIRVQKDDLAHSDSRFPAQGSIAQGVDFFNSDTSPSLSVTYPGTGADYESRDWSFAVTNGTVYLDDMYWDGGLDDDGANSNPRPLDKTAAGSAVRTWEVYED